MTTLYLRDVVCFVCEGTSQHYNIGSSNTMGPADLDTRPAEMMRSTLSHQIQDCPFCGYCAPDLSQGPESAVDVIRSQEYKSRQAMDDFPPLANRFMCSSLIRRSVGEYADAGWAALKAAWACDDVCAGEQAIICRKTAAELFEKAKKERMEFGQGVGMEEAILADVYRRAGLYEHAQFAAAHGLALKPEVHIVKILEFQKIKAKGEDDRRYTVDLAQ